MIEKERFKPGNMVYPVPAVMVSCADKDGRANIITVAWTGTICSDPAMLYISVRPQRYSYHMIEETGEFVVNLTTQKLAKATDYCGVRSGKEIDKWKEMHLTQAKADSLTYAPIIAESPVNIECKVEEIKQLGSHDMFIARVTGVQVSKEFMNENGRFALNETGLMAYSHGEYLTLGSSIGTFGWSVRKKKATENQVLESKKTAAKQPRRTKRNLSKKKKR